MSQSVKLPEELVDTARAHASLNHRSIPKQIEHWSRIGKAVEENPDLPYGFLKEILLARLEAQANEATPYEFD